MMMKTFEIAAKRSKKKQLIKVVGLSIIGVLVVTGIGIRTLQLLTANHANTVYKEHELLTQVAYPNIEYSTYYYKATGMFAGAVHADRHKNLAGIPVAFGDYEYHYDWMGSYHDPSQDGASYKKGGAYDRQTWTKLPLFFNTDVSNRDNTANSPSKELAMVKDMPNQLVEVAITFNKRYSYADLQKMLPKNLQQNWYWIGTQSKQEAPDRIDQLFGLRAEALQVVKLDDTSPQEIRERNALTPMKELVGKYKMSIGDYKLSNDLQAFLDKFGHTDFTKQSDIDKMEFAGVILTGQAEDFAQLENAEWIYASSIGSSTPKQPYHR
ncbi:anti sigma factor C-terminal domain-containing protein [Streptococcus ruminantium]|nr:anti sigma factor C-terminal domain-containing protein [Streptococcus ruminantium]